MPAPLPEFQRYQYAFAAHLRDPRNNARPQGTDAARMRVYRRLVYGNIDGFLLTCFPVLRKVLGARRWERLVRAFVAVHRSRSPYFRDIPNEFVGFLQDEWVPLPDYPEFMLELAHYEWVELALATSMGVLDWERIDVDGDLLARRPVAAPALANLCYRWPVHRIRPRTRVTPGETRLLVFRDAGERIRFIEINAFTARLMSLLEREEHTGREALAIIAAESRHPVPDAVIQGGAAAMQDLRLRGALLGVLREGR